MATRQKRTWHDGPPPHVGWWNASITNNPGAWRWWNGQRWSLACYADDRLEVVRARAAMSVSKISKVRWTTFWPTNARVPRVVP